jgi:hypothetical protein
MLTYRKIVSDVFNDLKATGLDDRLSFRYIISKLVDKARLLFKQDADSRRLFKISEQWKQIPCIPLCDEPLISCPIAIPDCTKLVKSRIKIPETFQTSYGNALIIMSLDITKKFLPTSFHAYRDLAAREIKDPEVIYYILLDGYLYIPDSELEEVRAFGLFKNPFEVTKLVEEGGDCLKPLDEPFPAPDYFIDIIKTQVFQEMGRVKMIIEDEKGDLNTLDKGQNAR